MKLTSVLLAFLLGAVASGPALAGGGHSGGHLGGHSGGHSFGRSGSPTFQGNHFHSLARSGFAVGHNGHFHRHFRSGVVIIGAPFFAPFYYPAPYYYYPPVAAMPYSSPDYIEQGGGEQAPAQSQAYWYYCADANAYYPYVKECPGGWQHVMPQAPPASNY
jgi:hypothetical protein